jgi:hypothetical protein
MSEVKPVKDEDHKRRPGRPTGPTEDRGKRPWDAFDTEILDFVFRHPDWPRYKIAEILGMSSSKLSCITCSPEGVFYLKEKERANNEA